MTIEYTVHADYVYEFLPTIDGKTLNMYINGDYHYDEWCESYYCPEGGTLDGYTCTGEDYDLEGGGNSYTCEFIEDNYYWVEHPGDLACDEGYEKGYDCGADEGPEGSCTAGDTDFTPCSGWCTWQGDYEATCDDPRESYDYYFTAGVVFK